MDKTLHYCFSVTKHLSIPNSPKPANNSIHHHQNSRSTQCSSNKGLPAHNESKHLNTNQGISDQKCKYFNELDASTQNPTVKYSDKKHRDNTGVLPAHSTTSTTLDCPVHVIKEIYNFNHNFRISIYKSTTFSSLLSTVYNIQSPKK